MDQCKQGKDYSLRSTLFCREFTLVKNQSYSPIQKMVQMERVFRTEQKKERVSTEEDLRTTSSAASRAKEHNLRHLKEAIDSYEKKSSSSKRRACRNLRLDDLRQTARKLSFEASPDGKSHSNSEGISAHLNSRDRALIENAHLFGNSSQLDPSPDIQIER